MSKSKRQKKRAIKSPRRLRMKRDGRLQSARATNWVGKFQGKHIVRAYENGSSPTPRPPTERSDSMMPSRRPSSPSEDRGTLRLY